MSDAECVAVVPSMVKIAIGFGGSHGKGVATCRTANGWSAPAPFSVTGGSWGLQIGGQAIDLVMLVMNKKGMDALLSSKFKIGADASAAAGPVGRQSEASTDWKMKAEVLTYSRARGVFAGIDLSGAKLSQDADETRILFGKMVPFATILSGKIAPPSGSEPFANMRHSRASRVPWSRRRFQPPIRLGQTQGESSGNCICGQFPFLFLFSRNTWAGLAQQMS
jgi:lipid-binding SYLF domain-containing protein